MRLTTTKNLLAPMHPMNQPTPFCPTLIPTPCAPNVRRGSQLKSCPNLQRFLSPPLRPVFRSQTVLELFVVLRDNVAKVAAEMNFVLRPFGSNCALLSLCSALHSSRSCSCFPHFVVGSQLYTQSSAPGLQPRPSYLSLQSCRNESSPPRTSNPLLCLS